MVAFVKILLPRQGSPSKQRDIQLQRERERAERAERERESTSFARRCLLYSGTFVSSNNMHDP